MALRQKKIQSAYLASAYPDPVVIIGAGMGGLSAAMSLAARNIPVIVLERHAAPGGKMRRVYVAAQPFDAGPTVLTMRWVFENLFAEAGLSLHEHLNLHKAELLARHSWRGGDSLDLFINLEQSMQSIKEFAGPNEADNYLRFARKTQETFETLDKHFVRAQRPGPVALGLRGGLRSMIDVSSTKPFLSLWNSLAKDFTNPRLRQLLARYASYCGSSPFKAPATLMLMAHVERAGVWMVEGGMHTLAKTLEQAASTLGADIRYGTGVQEIETQNDKVCGVITDSGERLSTQAVIFNGDTQALARGLLGEAPIRACPIRDEPSLSAVTYCQYASTKGFNLAHHTVFFGNDDVDEYDSIFTRKKITQYPTVYVCAQDRGGGADTRIEPDIAERLFSVVNAPARPMSDTERADAVARMLHTLKSQGLKIGETQGQSITTGPGQFGRLFPASDGAIYGRPTHGWTGSFKRPGATCGIDGLYLCGATVHPGAGVPMATISGQLAVKQLLSDRGALAVDESLQV